MRVLWIRFVVVTDPSVADHVLRNTADYDKPTDIYGLFDVVTSKENHATLFSSRTDEYWRMVRKAYAPAFHSKNLRQGFHHELKVNNDLAELLTALGPETPIEVHSLMERLALEATGKVGFAKEFGVLRAAFPGSVGSVHSLDNIFTFVNAAIAESERRFQNPLRKPLRLVWPGVRAGEHACHQFHQAMASLLDELKARGEEWAATDPSIAAHIIRATDKNGRRLPDDRLAAEIGTLFVAGELTTADTISWAMFLISQHPEVEAKIVAELGALGLLVTKAGGQPRAMTYEDLGKVSYLTSAIKEAMRMLPSASDGSFRESKRRVKMGGFEVPKGVVVWIPFYSMHNSSRNWPDAGQYMPERWLGDTTPSEDQDASSDSKDVKPSAFLPFSVGPRNCVGQAMAKMTYTTTLALLYSRFTFKLVQEGGAAAVEAQQHMSLSLQPSKGIHMLCIPRV
ncbi:hypothetical protein WJX72_006775 [[Myrmecia] bisecta]|uniref:Cytochrome P450 n=1 Tax=[Myrmecia] bisecta TaxID=41462 RepID=A0AAW1PT19_9CHLO